MAALEDAVRSGSTEPPASPALARYVEKLRKHAYRVTDDDIDALRADGRSESAIFEVTVRTALGEGMHRLRIGLALLDRDG